MTCDERPNRWIHLRHPSGFDEARFRAFRAHYEVWKAYCRAVVTNWSALPLLRGPAPQLVFFEPTLSDDRKTISIPLGGSSSLEARSVLENEASRLLWQFFLVDFLMDLEEGRTEDLGTGEGATTRWWRVLKPRAG